MSQNPPFRSIPAMLSSLLCLLCMSCHRLHLCHLDITSHKPSPRQSLHCRIVARWCHSNTLRLMCTAELLTYAVGVPCIISSCFNPGPLHAVFSLLAVTTLPCAAVSPFLPSELLVSAAAFIYFAQLRLCTADSVTHDATRNAHEFVQHPQLQHGSCSSLRHGDCIAQHACQLHLASWTHLIRPCLLG